MEKKYTLLVISIFSLIFISAVNALPITVEFNGTPRSAIITGLYFLTMPSEVFDLAPGSYSISPITDSANAFFDVDEAGSVIITSDPEGYLSASSSTLTVSTHPVVVDSDTTAGSTVLHPILIFGSGTNNLNLIPGTYQVGNRNGNINGVFSVNSSGMTSIISDPDEFMSISGSILTLTGHRFILNSIASDGSIVVFPFAILSAGSNEMKLIPGPYQIAPRSGMVNGNFDVEPSGNLSITSDPEGYMSVDGSTLTLQGLPVTMTVPTAGNYLVFPFNLLALGENSLHLIPGNYPIQQLNPFESDNSLTVAQDGSCSVTEVVFSAGTVDMSCELDEDDDGVSDGNDQCPGSVGTVDTNGCSDAQVDQDADGVCDPDAMSSGPSTCTGSDNCPVDPNPGQEDTDNDGVGSICDFGLETTAFFRGTGSPVTETVIVDSVASSATLKIWNGLQDSTAELVSSSVILLNGIIVVDSNNFNQQVSYLEVPVTLLAGANTLEVTVKGKPGGALTIAIE